MVSLMDLTMDTQPTCSGAMMRNWVARLPRKNRLLTKKKRPTLTMAAHRCQLQTRLMKRTTTILMLAKYPPNPRKSFKRDFDTFDETGDNSVSPSERGRWNHKKRRTKSPQAIQILQEFKSNPYNLVCQHEEVVEITDCPLFTWWYCLQMRGLWPILATSSYSSDIKTEFFFNYPLDRNHSLCQDILMAEDAVGEEHSEIPDHNPVVSQEDAEEMADVIYMYDIEAGEGIIDTEEDWIADGRPIEYSPEELRLIVEAPTGCAIQPCEYSPGQPWIFQVDIANITSDRMEVHTSPTIQGPLRGLEYNSNEKEELSSGSTGTGPIRTSPRRGQKGMCRGVPYDKSLRGILTFKTKHLIDKIVELPQVPLEMYNSPSVQDQESNIDHNTGANLEALPPTKLIEPASPCSRQIKVVDTDTLPPSEPVEIATPSNPQIKVVDIDDSGYASDDGLDQAFADAAEEIEKERAKREEDEAKYLWKPRVSSPLKNEVHPENEISSNNPLVDAKSTMYGQAPLSPKEGEEVRNHIALIYHLTTRDINEEGKRPRNRDCSVSDHYDRSGCRCRSTAVARGILRIGDGHLTPERIRKATHKQLKLIARLEDCEIPSKDLASDAVRDAYKSLEKLDYGVSYLKRGMPGIADLENHAEEIYQIYEFEHGREMSRKYRHIVRHPSKNQPHHDKEVLLQPRPRESSWQSHLREERMRASREMPWRAGKGIKEPSGLFS